MSKPDFNKQFLTGQRMKRYISVLFAIMFLGYTPGNAFISISQLSGPNNYSAVLADVNVPVSGVTSIDGSYTSSSYAGSPANNISYGLELETRASRRVDLGAGYILSPASNASMYNVWEISGGYSFGRKNLIVRLGMYFQDTVYEEQLSNSSWHGLNQYVYNPSIRATIYRNIKIGLNTALFSYSQDVNSLKGSVDSISLRNDRDLGSIVGVVSDFPSKTETLSVAYRFIEPLEIYGEWSKIYYERSIDSGNLSAYGIRYFFTRYFAFSVNFVNYNSQAFNTLGFGLYW